MKRRRRKPAILLALGLAVGLGAAALAAEGGALTIRVQDAIGEPGGPIAIVLRTYASKPLGQGQLCLRARPSTRGAASQAMASLNSVVVFSDAGDAQSEAFVDLVADPQIILVDFESLSATVNSSDGPLGVIHMQLQQNVVPGERFEIEVDLANSSLIDENGQTVQILPRNGRLTIRDPTDPISVSAAAEDTLVGEVAQLSLQTHEPTLVGLGQVGLRYDPLVADGEPTVEMDPRHGASIFGTSFPEPGLVVVQFRSPDGSLNEVPGDIVEVHLPTSAAVPPGTETPVTLDPALTFLLDPTGQPVPLFLESGSLLIVPREPGTVLGLALGKSTPGTLELSWAGDCGTANMYAVYRGDLDLGYGSLIPEPGACELTATAVTVPMGVADSEFFLVVPHAGGFEGSFGADSSDNPRAVPAATCHPVGTLDSCAP